jgi:hypothetical protein
MLVPCVSLMTSILLSGRLDGFIAGFAMVDRQVKTALARSLGCGIYSAVSTVTCALLLQHVPSLSVRVDEA